MVMRGVDPLWSIHRFPPVESPSGDGIEGETEVTHSHLFTTVWSSSLNHKQVSLLLFFHPSRLSSPPSASLWGSEAWETGSKHRSYDSAWPQIRGARGGDTVQSGRVGQWEWATPSAYSLSNVTHSVLVHIHFCLLSRLTFPNMQIYKVLKSTRCLGSWPNHYAFFRQTSLHLLPCCCFRAWHCGIAFHVPAGLRAAIVALLARDRYHKATVAWDELATFSHNNHCCSCCFCHCFHYEKHRSTISFTSMARPFLWIHTFSPTSKRMQTFVTILGESVMYFSSEQHTEPERARVCFSQDNYYFSGTALKQTCISHS